MTAPKRHPYLTLEDRFIKKFAKTAGWHKDIVRLSGWEHLGTGMNRDVYGHGQIVIKIPMNEEGLMDNDHEHTLYKRHKTRPDPDGVYYARCRLLQNGWLMMVRVKPDTSDNLPEWTDTVDCGQVGITASGRLVAFDYGC